MEDKIKQAAEQEYPFLPTLQGRSDYNDEMRGKRAAFIAGATYASLLQVEQGGAETTESLRNSFFKETGYYYDVEWIAYVEWLENKIAEYKGFVNHQENKD